jgi:hypothetical protein
MRCLLKGNLVYEQTEAWRTRERLLNLSLRDRRHRLKTLIATRKALRHRATQCPADEREILQVDGIPGVLTVNLK